MSVILIYTKSTLKVEKCVLFEVCFPKYAYPILKYKLLNWSLSKIVE
jgi:uncharacterized protein (DUF302 family)